MSRQRIRNASFWGWCAGASLMVSLPFFVMNGLTFNDVLISEVKTKSIAFVFFALWMGSSIMANKQEEGT